MSKLTTQELLTIVKDGFEEQKQIKVLSLYTEDSIIHGIYILPPEQSLSFQEEPLLDMTTDIDGHTIIMEELGQLLLYAYNIGSMYHFFKIIHTSDINIVSKSFDDLVIICSNNPPLQRIDAQLIEWLENTDNITQTKVNTFNKLCTLYNVLENIDVDTSISKDNNDNTYITKQFNRAILQIQSKKHQKIPELIIHKINQLYISMQIDLYTTDNK